MLPSKLQRDPYFIALDRLVDYVSNNASDQINTAVNSPDGGLKWKENVAILEDGQNKIIVTEKVRFIDDELSYGEEKVLSLSISRNGNIVVDGGKSSEYHTRIARATRTEQREWEMKKRHDVVYEYMKKIADIADCIGKIRFTL